MGWARTFLLGDIGNRLDIEDTEREIDRLRERIHDQRITDTHQDEDIAALQRRVEALELTLGGLARLLVSEGVLKPDALERLTSLVDVDEEHPS